MLVLTLLLCGGWCLMGEAAVSAKVTAASCQSICYQEATDAREAAVRAAAKKKLQDLSAWQTAYDTALDAVNAAADTNIETLAQANFDKATKQLTADAAIATANAARAKAVAGFQATVDQETKKSEAAQKKLKHAYDKEAKAAKLKAKLDGDVAEATAKDTYAKDIDKKTIVYKEYSKTLYDDRVTYTTAYAKCK